MAMTFWEAAVAVVGGGGLTTFATHVLNKITDRKRSKVETQALTSDVTSKVLKNVDDYLDRQKLQMDQLIAASQEDKKKISQLEMEICVVEEKHEECEFNNGMLLIEIETVRRMVVERSIPLQKIKVFVLDDSKLETMMFEHRLKKITLLEVRTFNSPDDFIAELAIQKPDIIVTDYHLSRGVTMEALLAPILAQPDYQPRIVVISADKSPELREQVAKLGIWRFFPKDGGYVNLVVKQIMQYVETMVT